MLEPEPVAHLTPGAVLRSVPVRPYDAFPLLVGPLPVVVEAVAAPQAWLDEAGAGLPEGPATAEAVAVRLRRRGIELRLDGPPGAGCGSLRELARLERRRGRAAVAVWRADPSLLTEVRLGAWTSGRTAARMLRCALLVAVGPVAAVLDRRRVPADSTAARAVADAAYWSGVRAVATRREWRLLTSSYVCFCYHRVAGEFLPGQERLDLSPERLRGQTRLLRALRWRPVTPDDLAALHERQQPLQPRRRRYLLTFDDGFPDALEACERHVVARPHAYVPTAAVGQAASWVPGGTPVAGWDAVRAARRAGVAIGGHGRRHRPLDGLTDNELADEVDGSYQDLTAEVDDPLAALAYPNGRHDGAARAAAARAGYRWAWTTAVGRNGAGTDPWCLRRAGVREPDTLLAFLWKAVTGELPPRRWQRRLDRRWKAGRTAA